MHLFNQLRSPSRVPMLSFFHRPFTSHSLYSPSILQSCFLHYPTLFTFGKLGSSVFILLRLDEPLPGHFSVPTWSTQAIRSNDWILLLTLLLTHFSILWRDLNHALTSCLKPSVHLHCHPSFPAYSFFVSLSAKTLCSYTLRFAITRLFINKPTLIDSFNHILS